MGQEYISIHAPLAGCDGAPDGRRDGAGISIHAPLAGCDIMCTAAIWSCGISIHAPLAGCDTRRSAIWPGCCYFNPRTPCGVRRARRFRISPYRRFQSTHPLRGATDLIYTDPPYGIFQSTHPLRGATTPVFFARRAYGISIHAPLAGCDDRVIKRKQIMCAISIHAPLAGCDT